MGKRKIALKHGPGLPEVDIELCLGWGGFYIDSIEKKRIEAAILPYLDSLPQTTTNLVPGEGLV